MPKRNAVLPGILEQQGRTKNPAVKSISRAVQLINSLHDGADTLTDIAERCRLSKSTVHRLLHALEDARLVSQNSGDHRYYLGPLMTALIAGSQLDHAGLVTCALREMKRLNELLGETVHASIMPALHNIIISEIPSKHDLRVTQENRRIGTTFTGATVRVLFSQFTPEQLRTVMKQVTLERVTDKSVVNKETFVKLVNDAKVQGYAVSAGEKVPGALGIAAPVFHYRYPAAIAIIGPDIRILPRIDEFIRELRYSAARISENVTEMFGGGNPDTNN